MSNLPTTALLTELRSKDYDRYILLMFGAAEYRDDLAALMLFNAELAQVRDQVSEPLLGLMRLQWWRDGLDALGTSTQPPHSLLDRFAALVRRGVDLTPLQLLIDAREHDLADHPFPNTAAYHYYQDATTRPLALVAAAILGQREAAGDFAAALANYAQIGLLRALPFWLHRNALPLPPDILAAHGIDGDAWRAGEPQPGLPALVKTIVQQQTEKIAALRQKLTAMPRPARHAAAPLLLHNDLAGFYAAQLRRRNYDVMNRRTPTSALSVLPTLLWRVLRLY